MKRRGYQYTAAALTALMLITGCQSRSYERVPIETSWSMAAKAEETKKETMSVKTQSLAVEETSVVNELQSDPAQMFEERSETVYVTAASVNIRVSATTESGILALANLGDTFTRTGYSQEWSRIDREGRTCYIASNYVSTEQPKAQSVRAAADIAQGGEIKLDSSWKYSDFSKINTGSAMLYRSTAEVRKGITICVNAGHGTQGGSSVKTLCHPDGTPKVTGGTTSAGATSAIAVSGGMSFLDGTSEAKVTLEMAKVLKEKLLAKGYDVLMIRESDDVQLDNIARTVIANNTSDCHIALHWDSTESNKGAFYMSTPNVASYRSMEPVASTWQKHNALGESLITGLRSKDVKIWSNGSMEMDLTQTSFSTIPSIDIELGDKASDYSAASLDKLGDGLMVGIERYFGYEAD